MEKSVSVITNALYEKLPQDLPFYTQDDLVQYGLPTFLVKRISHYVYLNILEQVSMPDQTWLNPDADSIVEAWDDLKNAIKQELRVPSGMMREVLKKSVRDCIELTVQPKRAIGKQLFENNQELDIAQITERASAITVNRYLVWSLIRYMEKKEKTLIDRKQAERILEKIDEKVVENYHPLNWLALVKPLYELCGPKVPTNLLRLFFEDKKQNPAAKEFDLLDSAINETEFIEVLSSPDLLYVEGFKDDQQSLFREGLDEDLEDPLNQKFMSSTEDLPEILPVDDESSVPDTSFFEDEDEVEDEDEDEDEVKVEVEVEVEGEGDTSGETETAPWDVDEEESRSDSEEEVSSAGLADIYLKQEESSQRESVQPLDDEEDELAENVQKIEEPLETEGDFEEDEEIVSEEDFDTDVDSEIDDSDPDQKEIGIEAIEIDESGADAELDEEKSLADSFYEPDSETDWENESDPELTYEPERVQESEPESEINREKEKEVESELESENKSEIVIDSEKTTVEPDSATEKNRAKEKSALFEITEAEKEPDQPEQLDEHFEQEVIEDSELVADDEFIEPVESEPGSDYEVPVDDETEEETLASRFIFDDGQDEELEDDDALDDATTIYDELNLSRKGAVPSTLDLFSMPREEEIDDDDDDDEVGSSDRNLSELDESEFSEEQIEDESSTMMIDTTGSDFDDTDDEELPMWRSFLEREDVETSSTFQFDDSRFGVTGEDEIEETETDTNESESEDEEVDSELLDEDGFIEEPIYDLTKEDQPIELKIGDLNEWMLDEKERFVEVIFGDSEDAYEEALADIIEYDDWKSASRYIEREIFARNRIDLYDETAVDFTDRLHSYFLEKKS